MLPQLPLIDRLRSLCQQDAGIAAALLGGSFPLGEADAYSDLDCVLYFYDSALATLDRRAWVGQIAPVLLFFADDFGHFTVIFDSLIRAEFHFNAVGDMHQIAEWQGSAWFSSAESAILLDRTDQLAAYLQPLIGLPQDRDTPETVLRLTANFYNVVLFGLNVLERGELARSLELLGALHRYLIWMARLEEGAIQHWPTPSRNLERDLSAATDARLQTCTAWLDREALVPAYANGWAWGLELAAALYARHTLTPPNALIDALSRRVAVVTQQRNDEA